MIKEIKNIALAIARKTRVSDQVANSGWRNSRVLILAYHGVALDDEHLWNPSLFVAQETFRARMQRIYQGGYVVLSLDEAVRRLQERTVPPRSVVLTFDDGTVDFHARALPVLKEFGFPATVYLTTYYCGRPIPVFDTMCSYLLWKGRSRSFDSVGLFPFGDRRSLAHQSSRDEMVRHIHNYVRTKAMTVEEKNALAGQIADRLDIDYQDLCNRRMLQIMSRSEVSDIARSGINVQLHTHRHQMPRSREHLHREISQNREEIARITGQADGLVHFCYPGGHYAQDMGRWLRQEGIVSATTCVPDLASSNTDPLFLPRVVDSSSLTVGAFDGWLGGVTRWMSRSVIGWAPDDAESMGA